MKKYIIPATDVLKIETSTILAGSLNKGTNGVSDETKVLSKENNFDFFAAPEVEEETRIKSNQEEEEWDEFEEEE